MSDKTAKLYQEGKTQEAIQALIKDIDHEPKNANNYLELSTYLLEQGAIDQAKKLLVQAKGLVKKPQDMDYNLAICYYMEGDFDRALALLDTIPNNDETYYQKALVFHKLGNPQKALAFAMSVSKVDNDLLELLGDIWLSLGDFARARENYLKIPKDERPGKLNFLIGVTLFGSNRQEAEQYFTLAEKIDPDYYQTAKKQYDSLLKVVKQGK